MAKEFKGELTDWLRFWSQFEAEIDRTEVAGVTKFSSEHGNDGLPFTTEGYERAKNILVWHQGRCNASGKSPVVDIGESELRAASKNIPTDDTIQMIDIDNKPQLLIQVILWSK